MSKAGVDVADWLERRGFAQYIEMFARNDVNGETLLTLTDQDLQSIGIASLPERRALLSEIEKLRATPAPPQTITSLSANELPDLTAAAEAPKKRRWRQIFKGNFLIISIAVHVLFAAGAAIWVVQEIQTKRKLTFRAGEKSPNRGTRALEHKVQLQKKQQTMTAPAHSKRILSTGLSKVTLPDMPAMPVAAAAANTKMAGAGTAPGALGRTAPMAAGGTGGGGPPISFFGVRSSAKRIAFLLDYSGSMSGEFRKVMEQELQKALSKLSVGSQLLIIPWAGPAWLHNQTAPQIMSKWKKVEADGQDAYDNFTLVEGAKLDPPTWIPAGPEGIEKIMNGLRAQVAAPGGTDWRQPFRYAMEANPPPDVIMFMTDGQIPAKTSARALNDIEASLKKVPRPPVVNCLWIENPTEKPNVLRQLAARYGGEFREVSAASASKD